MANKNAIIILPENLVFFLNLSEFCGKNIENYRVW